jgi:hypothetical protein
MKMAWTLSGRFLASHIVRTSPRRRRPGRCQDEPPRGAFRPNDPCQSSRVRPSRYPPPSTVWMICDGPGPPVESNAASGGACGARGRSCPALPNAGTPAGAPAEFAGSYWLNRHTDELARDSHRSCSASRPGSAVCHGRPGVPFIGAAHACARRDSGGHRRHQASLAAGSGGPAGVFNGCRGCGGWGGGCARLRAGLWRADGAGDGFMGTHQFVIDVPEGADRPAHTRRCPPRTLAASCRCHRDHLSAVRAGLCVKPLLLLISCRRGARVCGRWRAGGERPGAQLVSGRRARPSEAGQCSPEC